MSNTLRNLLVVLGLLTVGYAAYYLYSTRTAATPDDFSAAELQQILTRTQVFIERRQELERMPLDLQFLADERFRSLESNTAPLEVIESGRSNPFATVSGS